MNWRGFLLNASVLVFTVASYGQANILNANSPEEIGKKTEAQIQSDINDKPRNASVIIVARVTSVWFSTIEIIPLDSKL